MSRSVGRVFMGWTCGFIVALLAGANRAHNAGLGGLTLALGIAGMVLLVVLMAASGLRDRAARRAEERALALEEAENAVAAAQAAAQAAAASALADASAARIAQLETLLATEEQELEAAIAAMGDQAAAAQAGGAAVDPALREQVLDTVAGLVATVKPRRRKKVARKVDQRADAAGAEAVAGGSGDAPDPILREQVLDAVAGLAASPRPRRRKKAVRDGERKLEDAG